MIPTYNCAAYLRQTLESVLAQDMGAEQMQIEVVDDCSTKDHPEAVVHEVGKGRVSFHRKPKNEGAIANFNTCIERSHGHLVHILHGDDHILPGFFEEISKLQSEERCKHWALFATRVFFINEINIITGFSERIPTLENGGKDAAPFHFCNGLQFAGTVVRRSFYEAKGGFCPSLIHCADWEMWMRAVHSCGGVVSTKIMAAYRIFEGNDTSRLMRSGENLMDRKRLIELYAKELPQYPRGEAIKRLVAMSRAQAYSMQAQGDHEAASAARRFYVNNAPLVARCIDWCRRVSNGLFRRMESRLVSW